MIVVDTSVLLEVLLRTPAAIAVQRRIVGLRQQLHVPHLLDLEIAQVIRRYVLAGDIDVHRGREALSDLADWPLQRYSHYPWLQRIWELRSNFTAYDAAYVALAETLDAPLLTRDRRMAAAAREVVAVEVL